MTLTVNGLMKQAETKAGLTDWGTDTAFQAGLEALVHAAKVDNISAASEARF